MKIKRPFAVRYNPYNSSIEILSNAQQVSNIVSDLKGDICIIFDALKKIEETEQNSSSNNSNDKKHSLENLKLFRQYRKLEETFRDLSLDLHEQIEA